MRLSADLTTAAAPTTPAPSRWGPFSHLAFTVIWAASLVSNVGTAMFDTSSGWLITSLDANPITVSLVQVAVSLPLFLFTLPSGALADVIDSRRLLIAVEVGILAVSVVFAGLVSLNLATPSLLLATTFLLGVGGALTSPAWGATIPMLVPKQDLDSATAANGVAFNIGRAAGPALGGLVIAALGIAIPFWAFAASNVGIIAALIWWRSPRKGAHGLPAERLTSAIRAGVRHAANNPDLGATLVRVCAFFPFASAYLALLPLLARHLMSEGPQLYGILLAAIGVGTVGGSLIIRWLKDELGPDRFVAAGSLGAAFALVLFGLAHDPITAVSACLLGGASWTVVLTKLYVSAQVALPDWARGRGLAVFRSRHNRPPDCAARSRRELRRDHRRCEGLTKRALGRLGCGRGRLLLRFEDRKRAGRQALTWRYLLRHVIDLSPTRRGSRHINAIGTAEADTVRCHRRACHRRGSGGRRAALAAGRALSALSAPVAAQRPPQAHAALALMRGATRKAARGQSCS